jgi:hypothetical protein
MEALSIQEKQPSIPAAKAFSQLSTQALQVELLGPFLKAVDGAVAVALYVRTV